MIQESALSVAPTKHCRLAKSEPHTIIAIAQPSHSRRLLSQRQYLLGNIADRDIGHMCNPGCNVPVVALKLRHPDESDVATDSDIIDMNLTRVLNSINIPEAAVRALGRRPGIFSEVVGWLKGQFLPFVTQFYDGSGTGSKGKEGSMSTP